MLSTNSDQMTQIGHLMLKVADLEHQVRMLNLVKKGVDNQTQGWEGDVLTLGAIRFTAAIADADAPINSLYYSSTTSKLTYKNFAGVANVLY